MLYDLYMGAEKMISPAPIFAMATAPRSCCCFMRYHILFTRIILMCLLCTCVDLNI